MWADPQILNTLVQVAAAGKGRRVYVAVGEKENIDETQRPQMIEGAAKIAETVSAPGSGYTVETRVFVGGVGSQKDGTLDSQNLSPLSCSLV